MIEIMLLPIFPKTQMYSADSELADSHFRYESAVRESVNLQNTLGPFPDSHVHFSLLAIQCNIATNDTFRTATQSTLDVYDSH